MVWRTLTTISTMSDDGGLDGDDDGIDDESGEDDDVPEDEEDDEGTEPGRKEPEQPKEKGAFVCATMTTTRT